MPVITTKQTVEIDTDISVYCDTCGAGLCQTVRVDHARDSFHVPVCADCIKEKDDIIIDLEKQIRNLEQQLENK